MRIAIGGDHHSISLKQTIIKWITNDGHSYKDFGTYTTDPVDYPDIAKKVAEAVAEGNFDRGILICGTGIGMCIAANKVNGIRAAQCFDTFCAVRSRQHNDANILCLGSEEPQPHLREIVDTFLSTEFEGGRHQRRVDEIKAMES